MLTLPPELLRVRVVFAPVCSNSVWPHGKVLITGAILAPGQRTVPAVLRVMGHHAAPHFQTDRRLLHRAVWAPFTTSRLLLRLCVAVLVPWGVVVCGLEDTSERRRGAHLEAKGVDRAPGRSSRAHVVKVSGRRWLWGLLLTHRPWAQRVWALPFMTVRCPSERFDAQRHRPHRPLVERAWPIIRLVVR